MYDIIFIGNNAKSFSKLRERFPTAKRVLVNGDILDAFNDAKRKALTKMFWIVWDDVIIDLDFKFEYQVPSWDEEYIHLFLNDTHYDGICLVSKTATVSKRELSCRFFIKKKETGIHASVPMHYDIFNINSYDEYLNALETARTELFWIIPRNVNVNENFKFDLYFSHHDQYNRQTNHVFRNGNYYDGIILATKQKEISKREFDYRFLANKKEWDIVASSPTPFDVVFISYFEKFAEENFQKMLGHLQPGQRAYRVNGIKGIHQAHKCAAELVSSDMFWVVDADAILEPNFNFEFPQVVSHDTYTKSIVHVWRSRNPINGLEYGYGGVKLLPKKLTMNMDMSKPDMTTSISASFKVMPEISNITAFNTDAFSTWRSAFRECVKLSSNIIDRHQYQENAERLNAWLTFYPDKPFAQEAVEGAYDGREYGRKNAADPAALALINDFDWLKNRFEQTPPTSERFQ